MHVSEWWSAQQKKTHTLHNRVCLGKRGKGLTLMWSKNTRGAKIIRMERSEYKDILYICSSLAAPLTAPIFF